MALEATICGQEELEMTLIGTDRQPKELEQCVSHRVATPVNITSFIVVYFSLNGHNLQHTCVAVFKKT